MATFSYRAAKRGTKIPRRGVVLACFGYFLLLLAVWTTVVYWYLTEQHHDNTSPAVALDREGKTNVVGQTHTSKEETKPLKTKSNSGVEAIETRKAEPQAPTPKEADQTTAGTAPSEDKLKCSPWEVNMDDWWQDHPDWEPFQENDTHTCFRPIADPQRAGFYRQVHVRQFPKDLKKGCSMKRKDPHKIFVAKVYDYGFAATILHLLTEGIWSAFLQERPFQYGHHEANFRWLYVPPPDAKNKNRSSPWPYCPSQDFTCFFLNLSSCPRPPLDAKDEHPKKKHLWGDTEKNQTLWVQNIWMSHFVARPRQELRQHFHFFWEQHATHLVQQLQKAPSCTWIHVRRGDAMTEKNYARNFYPIEEYLTSGKIKKGESILLLTDDQSAIEEATLLHPDYQWMYWDRTRNRGPTAFNSHFPSGDPVLEVLILLAETQLASHYCRKGVYGKSNMARWIRNEAVVKHGAESIQYTEFDKGLRKTRVEPAFFMKDLEAKLADARRRKQHQDQ